MSKGHTRDELIAAHKGRTTPRDVLDIEVGGATEPAPRAPRTQSRRDAHIEEARRSPHASARRRET